MSVTDDILNQLRLRSERRRALDCAYSNPDRIQEFLDAGLLNPEQVREIRRFHLFNSGFDLNKSDEARRVGLISDDEYFEAGRKYHLAVGHSNPDTALEGIAEGFLTEEKDWMVISDVWVREMELDNESWYAESILNETQSKKDYEEAAWYDFSVPD